jgi:hypothetical protein
MQEYVMTNPKYNAKKTGDVHPPDVESEPFQEGMTDPLGAEGTPREHGKSTERGQQSPPGRKAGVLKDKDDETSENYSNSRESGKGLSGNKG